MNISPAVKNKLKEYFATLKEDKRKLKKLEKIGKIWIVGEIYANDNGSDKEVSGPVDSVTEVVNGIKNLSEQDASAIELSICSQGGSVSAGLAICDYLRRLDVPIITVAYGEVKSMAAVIFQLGAIRKMTACSTLMLHHVTGGAEGTPTKIATDAKVSKYYNELLFTLISLRSGISVSKLKKMTDPVKYFTPQEALKLNLADKII